MAPQLVTWEPEDRSFWARGGAQIAWRNLVVSVAALMLAFAVWMMWSVVVVQLPHAGFRFSPNQLFWLVALPGLAGGTLRLFFAFMVPVFGGRRWTAVSTGALLIPVVGFAIAIQDPTTGYPTFLVLALAAGLGGGNFASSMANISFFFPAHRKGTAMGWNAGLGNLGVALAQLVIPLVVGSALLGSLGGGPQTWIDNDSGPREIWLQNAGWIWVLPIVVVALAAWTLMDDLDPVRASFDEQAVIFMRKHNWLLAWLYLGSFGSFIGLAAGFPLLVQTEFAGIDTTAWAFVGPLLGALARPVGGALADHVGGARVALTCFVVMAAATTGLAIDTVHAPSVIGYGSLFGVLFIASGAGNGAVAQLFPAVFVADRRRALAGQPDGERQALREGALEGAAALGFASAVAAFGGFFIPKAYGTAVVETGEPTAALVVFVLFYLSCAVVTWWNYVRSGANLPCQATAPRP